MHRIRFFNRNVESQNYAFACTSTSIGGIGRNIRVALIIKLFTESILIVAEGNSAELLSITNSKVHAGGVCDIEAVSDIIRNRGAGRNCVEKCPV
jgi:hypothetical protein